MIGGNTNRREFLQKGTMGSKCESQDSIKRYMQCTAAAVRYLLEETGTKEKAERLLMTGGATLSSYWPQALANICNLVVEAINMPEFTAYGAALFARAAVAGDFQSASSVYKSKIYRPECRERFDDWYKSHQVDVFEKMYKN